MNTSNSSGEKNHRLFSKIMSDWEFKMSVEIDQSWSLGLARTSSRKFPSISLAKENTGQNVETFFTIVIGCRNVRVGVWNSPSMFYLRTLFCSFLFSPTVVPFLLSLSIQQHAGEEVLVMGTHMSKETFLLLFHHLPDVCRNARKRARLSNMSQHSHLLSRLISMTDHSPVNTVGAFIESLETERDHSVCLHRLGKSTSKWDTSPPFVR